MKEYIILMKKIIPLFFYFIVFFIIINSNLIVNNILFSFNICFNNLFPSLIPFLLLSNIIINYNLTDEISNIFKFIAVKIFKLNKNCSFVLFMSIISGAPSNSKYLKDLYDNNLIDNNDINKCLTFCHFTNPIFVINTIGLNFFSNKKIGIIILISQILSSFVIGLFCRNMKSSKTNIKKTNIDNKFINVLNNSIINTANSLLLILGIITFCLIITSIIDSVFYINNDYKFIYGLLEITQGLKYLSISNLNITIKIIIASFIISFGGICIHMQVFSILDNKKIRYLPYLFSRLIHASISSIITIVLLHLNCMDKLY